VTIDDSSGLTWSPPGPGSWMLDRTHKATTLTQPWQDVFGIAMAEGFRSWTARYGLPLSHLEVRFVHGYAYIRPVPAGVRDTGRAGPPPRALLRVLVRLVPELRCRAGAARRAVDERIWLADARRWWEKTRPARLTANLVLQDVDLASADSAALSAHLHRANAALGAGLTEHFGLIGAISVPVGSLLVAAEDWGTGPAEVLELLRGSSPGSLELASSLARVGGLLAQSDTTISSVEEIPPGSAAAVAVDEALCLHGWRLFADADLDAPTLGELPGSVAALINAGTRGPAALAESSASVDAVRQRVPARERACFERLLTEARGGYALRDDNVGVCVQWTGGLLRRALLEAGRRLAASGALEIPEHVFELHVSETAELLIGGQGPGRPDAASVAARAEARSTAAPACPPPLLGPPAGAPPVPSVFPRAMAEVTQAVDAYRCLMAGPQPASRPSGTGIGTGTYRGRAVVVADAAEAMARITPGDVLVMAVTNPCVNPALALAGAVVSEQGGLLCHTAIAARELGLPAVVGLHAATTRIPDGAIVEVDPAQGTVVVSGDQAQEARAWW
jgi:rifampicin phosphotransferase